MEYPHLLSPLRVGNMVLKNRLLYANATPYFLQGPETFPAEGLSSYYGDLAKNGAGVITFSPGMPYPVNRQGPRGFIYTHMPAFDLKDDSVLNYLSLMAERVHLYGSKLILNIEMRAPQGYSASGGLWGPPGEKMTQMTKPLTYEMMKDLRSELVETMQFYRDLGFDGLTMRVDNYMRANETGRQDEYGGSVKNRTRFAMEALQDLRDRFGADILIELQLAGEQPLGYAGECVFGYSLDETVEFARIAEGTADILQLREKDITKSHPTGYTHRKNEHMSVAYAEAIKAAGVRILTEPIGGFQDPAYMEECLRLGKCDMFGMVRGFIADPEYGKKLLEDRGAEIVPCIQCNKCHGTKLPEPEPYLTVCSVNPRQGLQSIPTPLFDAPETPKKVAVIGGGPAGMQAAITLSERGHQVTLYEKTGYLGGQLIHAESFSFKWPIKEYRDYLVRMTEKCGVQVLLHTEATPERIRAGNYDAVYAALGAGAVLPDSIGGLKDRDGNHLVPTCHDVFGREDELGKRVVVVGGSETGMETAMYLAENGHEVTVLTRQAELGHSCSKLHYITAAWVKPDPQGGGHQAPAWEQYGDRLRGICGVTATRVEQNTVWYTDCTGAEQTIDADSVVICGGTRPRMDEALAFSGAADRFFMIGDCVKTGNLQRCIRDAWSKANLL